MGFLFKCQSPSSKPSFLSAQPAGAARLLCPRPEPGGRDAAQSKPSPRSPDSQDCPFHVVSPSVIPSLTGEEGHYFDDMVHRPQGMETPRPRAPSACSGPAVLLRRRRLPTRALGSSLPLWNLFKSFIGDAVCIAVFHTFGHFIYYPFSGFSSGRKDKWVPSISRSPVKVSGNVFKKWHLKG